MDLNTKQRWTSLWQRLGAQGDADVIYDDLIKRYSEPFRAYHTLQHIEHCLCELEQVRSLATNPDSIELAIWYHDTIYDTSTTDNEEQSATLMVETMRDASLPDDFIQSAANLILATQHLVVPVDSDTQLFVDIDLSILGQAEDRFDEYEQQVRKEYEWVPEDSFVSGRLTILKSFLDRPRIYSTTFFYDKYEKQARANIARSITKLNAQ